jgi:virginiamycin A acetyltransferase
MLKIAKTAKLAKLIDIEDSIKGTVVHIGENSVIDSFVKIKPVGGTGDVIIGNNTYINSGCVIYSGNGVSIGDNVLIAANCTFAATNHAYLDKDKLIREQGFSPSKGGIIIEDDVWIGSGCTLLDGSIIRRGAVIGANSLVNKEVEAYSINVGNPIKQTGFRE